MEKNDAHKPSMLIRYSELDLTLKTLYQLYCFEPTKEMISLLQESELLSLWQKLTHGAQKTLESDLDQEDAIDQLKADHLALFVGIGMPLSPPWGSVYLNEENLLLQSSTYEWMDFLKHQNLRFVLEENQPQDNIGLILSAVATLYERYYQAKVSNGDVDSALRALRIALSEHLSPWITRFCQLLAQHAETSLYRLVSDVTAVVIDQLMSEVQATIEERELYY